MRKISSLFTLALAVSTLLFVLPKSALAQDADPPSRVARLNYVQGSVSYQMPGDQTWIDADSNRPLTTGNSLWVDKSSRGEVHIGSTAIRLASETGISFLTLDDRTVQLELAQGTMEIHLRHQSPDEAFEIDTPNLSFTLSAAGEYRIQTDPDGNSTLIVVREGAGQVDGGGDSWDLRSGRQYVFNGSDQLSYDARPEPRFDEFEDWCQSRDQRENRAASAQYVSRDVDGYYDLDDYGDWVSESDYGMVWVPRAVAAGWSPYHVGHWVYIAPWGWTWVDAEPWGFAPFHYGRWVTVRDHWGWVPGPVVIRPVYSPAVVGFVGGNGSSISVSFGGGFAGVGWFPLGPRDVYVPAYRCSPRYFQTINVTNTRVVNVTQVTNVYNTVVINRNTTHVDYMYAHNSGAVTAVSRETFVNARRVDGAAVRVNNDQIARARVFENAPIAPVRGSYVAAAAQMSTSRPPVSIQQRPVVVRMNPATPVRERNAPASQNQNTRPFDRQAPSQIGNNNQPGARVNSNNAPNGAQPNNGRNGNNVPPPTNNQPQPQQQQQPRDGFHPFQPSAGGNSQGKDASRNNSGNNAPQSPNNPPNARVNNNPNNGGNVQPPSNNNPPPPQQQQQQRDGLRGFQPPAGGNSPGADASRNNNGNNAPQSPNNPPNARANNNPNNGGNVQPPSNNNPQQQRNNNSNNPAPNDGNRNQNYRPSPQTQQNNDRPAMRYAPPVRAKDDSYDVHPPLNQKDAQTPPPKQEDRSQQKEDERQRDKGKDDNNKRDH